MTSCGICQPDFSQLWQTDLAGIQEGKSGVIVSCEEKSGEILVSLADRVGDCHIFRLNHPGKSTQEALDILRRTMEEQSRAKPNPTPDGLRQPADGSPKPSK